MTELIYDRHSDCCNAPMSVLKTVPETSEKQEIFYFRCEKCKKPCHMKKKHRS